MGEEVWQCVIINLIIYVNNNLHVKYVRTLSTEEIKPEDPTIIKTSIPVTLCSL